jgi:hypothetical protein
MRFLTAIPQIPLLQGAGWDEGIIKSERFLFKNSLNLSISLGE